MFANLQIKEMIAVEFYQDSTYKTKKVTQLSLEFIQVIANISWLGSKNIPKAALWLTILN